MMLVLCVAICLTSLIEASTVPPCICTMDYTPVCGVDGKTYGNKCGLDCVGVQLDHQGECGQKPPCICPKIYMPVCGDDGVTYANQCEMTCVGTVALVSTGVCPTTTSGTGGIIKRAVAPGCICPFIYMPVCGSDGITYGNECNLNCTAKASASPTPNTCCEDSVEPSQDETILLSAHKSVWSDGMVSERNVP